MKSFGPKEPSSLGVEVEAAVESNPRYKRHRHNVRYLCTFRTSIGTVFGFERVSKQAIRLWLPPTEEVKARANECGIAAPSITIPWSDPTDPTKYGRLSSLKAVPELRDEPLLPIPVTSASEALAVLAALK